MKALVLNEINQPLEYTEHDTPSPAPGEALVRIHAAALNHRDIWIQHGQYPGITTPIILGSDGCGVVESVEDGDNDWVGKEVILNPSLDWGDNPRFQNDSYSILGLPRNGTFAQWVTIPQANLALKPSHLSSTQAAALPLAGLTAWRALMSRAALQPGERVLISGVGGGVALFAMQFALAHQAEVWVTSSDPEKIARAVQMGAKGGFLYSDPQWHKEAAKTAGLFDVIIDSAGGEGFGSLIRLFAPGGRLSFYGGTRGKWPAILPQHLFYKQVSIHASTMGSPQDFAAMVQFVEEHQLTPIVDGVFPLEDGASAFAHLDSGKQFGKVVLSMTS